MTLYFLTKNANKGEETAAFFAQTEVNQSYDLQFRVLAHDVQEILHPNLEKVIKHKALEAYRCVNHPCVVEQSGLFFDGLPTLPGPLGRIIWAAVGERMCDFLRKGDSRKAIARAVIGYCDGKQVRIYEGNTPGEITERARGDYNTLNWDPIFVPDGDTETYAEMGRERKYETSPLIKAWREFLKGEFPDPVVSKR